MFGDKKNVKHQETRLDLLMTILNSNERVNANSFIREMRNLLGDGSYTQSNRTFYRDIEILKQKYKDAIHYDKNDKKFYLTKIMEVNEIQIEEHHVKNFVLAARLMQGIMPDDLMEEWGKTCDQSCSNVQSVR